MNICVYSVKSQNKKYGCSLYVNDEQLKNHLESDDARINNNGIVMTTDNVYGDDIVNGYDSDSGMKPYIYGINTKLASYGNAVKGDLLFYPHPLDPDEGRLIYFIDLNCDRGDTYGDVDTWILPVVTDGNCNPDKSKHLFVEGGKIVSSIYLQNNRMFDLLLIGKSALISIKDDHRNCVLHYKNGSLVNEYSTEYAILNNMFRIDEVDGRPVSNTFKHIKLDEENIINEIEELDERMEKFAKTSTLNNVKRPFGESTIDLYNKVKNKLANRNKNDAASKEADHISSIHIQGSVELDDKKSIDGLPPQHSADAPAARWSEN